MKYLVKNITKIIVNTFEAASYAFQYGDKVKIAIVKDLLGGFDMEDMTNYIITRLEDKYDIEVDEVIEDEDKGITFILNI